MVSLEHVGAKISDLEPGFKRTFTTCELFAEVNIKAKHSVDSKLYRRWLR
jgi:hypothetical protein